MIGPSRTIPRTISPRFESTTLRKNVNGTYTLAGLAVYTGPIETTVNSLDHARLLFLVHFLLLLSPSSAVVFVLQGRRCFSIFLFCSLTLFSMMFFPFLTRSIFSINVGGIDLFLLSEGCQRWEVSRCQNNIGLFRSLLSP